MTPDRKYRRLAVIGHGGMADVHLVVARGVGDFRKLLVLKELRPGFADSAAKDRALAHAVAEHKSIFFAESMPDGTPIDYRAAVTGALDLAPGGDARKTLAEDYQRMIDDGLLLDDAEPFDVLLQRCQALALKVNTAALGAA